MGLGVGQRRASDTGGLLLQTHSLTSSRLSGPSYCSSPLRSPPEHRSITTQFWEGRRCEGDAARVRESAGRHTVTGKRLRSNLNP